MIDGDTVEPGAPGGVAAELVHLAEGLQEHIVGGILGLLRVAEEAQGQVIDGAAVLLVQLSELGRRQPGVRPGRRLARLRRTGLSARGGRTFTFCQRLAHECVHCRLDMSRGRMSRRE
jgi:hypothetical protein